MKVHRCVPFLHDLPASPGETPPGKSKSSRRVAEIVTTLQSFIQQVGKDDLHQLIDAL